RGGTRLRTMRNQNPHPSLIVRSSRRHTKLEGRDATCRARTRCRRERGPVEDPHGRAAENTANTEETGAAEGGMTDTGETTSTTAAETVAPDEPDVDDWTLVRYIRRLTMEADRFLQALSDLHDLHRTDLAALSAIMDAADEGRLLSQGDLAATLNLSASATTS